MHKTGGAWIALLLATVLSGCGGGGGGGTGGSAASQDSGSSGTTSNVAAADFAGNLLLGQPTASTLRLSIFSSLRSGRVQILYGLSPGVYTQQTTAAILTAGSPLLQTLSGLAPDTTYYYRLRLQPADGDAPAQTPECRFHTARPAGSAFRFTIQADSHLDEESDLDIYHLTLANALADLPDFHVDLGDTFMTEKYPYQFTAAEAMAPDQAAVNTRYVYERSNFGRITHSVPLFLVNGNHDAELGWLNTGTSSNNAIWATLARETYFLNPLPDGFYSGDTLSETYVGQRAAWYAWTWGDALFVVLDPFWKSVRQASKDGWNITLGDRQYTWLASTLAASTAKYKFVFVHNLVGGLDGQMRGGIEAAPYYEWGGKNADGSDGFASKRPGWALPIHQLLVQNKVTAVFHGHDHLYAQQDLDGIVYQEVPQPSASNTNSGPGLARDYHYSSGTILSSSGYLRVTVSATGVRSEYVRTWLPASETSAKKNGEIAASWSVGVP